VPLQALSLWERVWVRVSRESRDAEQIASSCAVADSSQRRRTGRLAVTERLAAQDVSPI